MGATVEAWIHEHLFISGALLWFVTYYWSYNSGYADGLAYGQKMAEEEYQERMKTDDEDDDDDEWGPHG